LNRTEANQRYGQLIADAQEQGGPAAVKVMLRCLATSDLFFLLTKVLRRKDADNDWCYARCNEVQEEPDGYLDLWAREHYKSTIITFALTIQNILEDPNITVGIFSHTRPIAKAFLRQIKREFENNKILLDLFPDVVWEQPHRDSPKWSEDEGIIVKRSANPKEATVEAWGLVDGQPVSKHYKLMVYDDVVTRESVTNPEMVQKVTKAWEESRSLTISDGSGKTRCMGTRWHFADTYRDIIKKGSVKVRLYTEVDDMGNLVLWSPETQLKKRRDMGPYVYACQIKQDPKMDSVEGFKAEWLQYWPADSAQGMNVYILCDPAGEKKKENDYTVFWVVGANSDENYYILDVVRDRLNLTERGDILFSLHKKYRKVSLSVKVGYEKVGMQSDIEHYEDRMRREGYRFRIIPIPAAIGKSDRIKKLIPLFEQGRIYLPEKIVKVDYEGNKVDLVRAFVAEEYEWFPFPVHDDMLDSLAKITEKALGVSFPDEMSIPESSKYTYSHFQRVQSENLGYDPLHYGLH